MKGARKLDDFASLVVDDAQRAALLDQVKQIALYTDCLGNRNWSNPETVITKDLATQVVRIAELLARREMKSVGVKWNFGFSMCSQFGWEEKNSWKKRSSTGTPLYGPKAWKSPTRMG
jgi:AbiV